MLPKERDWRGARPPSSGDPERGPWHSRQGLSKPGARCGSPVPGDAEDAPLPGVRGRGLADPAGAEGGVPARRRRRRLGSGRLPGQPGICGRAVPLAARQGRAGGHRRTPACRGRTPNSRRPPPHGYERWEARPGPNRWGRESSPAPGACTPPPGPRGSERVSGDGPRAAPPSIYTHLRWCRRSPLPGPWRWALLL